MHYLFCLQKLTITRLPDVGICHIKPLLKDLPNPRELNSEMSFVSFEIEIFSQNSRLYKENVNDYSKQNNKK